MQSLLVAVVLVVLQQLVAEVAVEQAVILRDGLIFQIL
jgi:hypothetical protein